MMTSCNMNTWSVVLVIWYCCLVAVVHSRLLPFHHSNHAMSSSSHLSNEKATISTEKIPTSHKSNLIDKTKLRRYLSIRGGSTMSADSSSSSGAVAASTSTVVVSTSLGSLFLDKKKKLTLPSNSTIGQLKEQLQVKFPGSPPSSLQRLFFGNRLLANHEVLNNLTTLPVVPLLLDMITGTSAYNKTLSVTQGIDAYVSSVVQLAYLGDMLTNALTSANPALTTSNPSESGLNDDENNIITTQQVMKTIYYRQLYEIVNASIYDMYAEDIAMALEDEKNPETFAEDTKAWRGKDKKAKSPLVIAMAKEFDLNIRGLKNFVYFSIVLVVSSELYPLLC